MRATYCARNERWCCLECGTWLEDDSFIGTKPGHLRHPAHKSVYKGFWKEDKLVSINCPSAGKQFLTNSTEFMEA